LYRCFRSEVEGVIEDKTHEDRIYREREYKMEREESNKMIKKYGKE
jgi:hypothetical protein